MEQIHRRTHARRKRKTGLVRKYDMTRNIKVLIKILTRESNGSKGVATDDILMTMLAALKDFGIKKNHPNSGEQIR